MFLFSFYFFLQEAYVWPSCSSFGPFGPIVWSCLWPRWLDSFEGHSLSHFIPLLVLFYFDKLFDPKILLVKAHHWSLFPTAINFSHLRQPPPTPASFWLPSQASIADGYRLQQEEKKISSSRFHKFSASGWGNVRIYYKVQEFKLPLKSIT
jgi:hypothetical protein